MKQSNSVEPHTTDGRVGRWLRAVGIAGENTALTPSTIKVLTNPATAARRRRQRSAEIHHVLGHFPHASAETQCFRGPLWLVKGRFYPKVVRGLSAAPSLGAATCRCVMAVLQGPNSPNRSHLERMVVLARVSPANGCGAWRLSDMAGGV